MKPKQLFLYLIFLSGCLTLAAQNSGRQLKRNPAPLNQDSLNKAMVRQQKTVARQMAGAEITCMAINTPDHRFGYYIFIDGQMAIAQKTIPAIPGNQGFISEPEALKTAKLAIRKMKQGEMMPTISISDLQKLGITLPQ